MIADLYPCSFIDFPGELSAVIFTQGCDLRCRYCHNPKLCSKSNKGKMTIENVVRFLSSRKKKLTAVTVTGGEPTLHPSLPSLLSRVRKMGFKIKLDTNGMRPEVVRDLIGEGLVDYAAVDVKAAPGVDGAWLTGASNQGERALETLGILASAHLSFEARTTVVRGIHDEAHLLNLAGSLMAAGVNTWRLQPFQSGEILDSNLLLEAPCEEMLARVARLSNARGMDVAVRRGALPTVALPNGMPKQQPVLG